MMVTALWGMGVGADEGCELWFLLEFIGNQSPVYAGEKLEWSGQIGQRTRHF